MFCPTCESEYEAGNTVCADDGTQLVDKLNVDDGASDSSEASFVVLHTLSSPAEAEMVNDILQQNGIRSVVQSGASDQFSPLFSVMAPGAQVLVDQRDLDRAKELYAAFFGDDTSPLTGAVSEEEESDADSE